MAWPVPPLNNQWCLFEFITPIIYAKILHLEIVWVIGRQLQLSHFSESGTGTLSAKKAFWLAHHRTAAWSPNCKLQLLCIPGQFVVVQHTYIASINFPRALDYRDKFTQMDLWAAGGFESYFIYLLSQHCLWVCGFNIPRVVTWMANTTFWWKTRSTSPKGKLSLYFCQVTRRNVLLNSITVYFL